MIFLVWKLLGVISNTKPSAIFRYLVKLAHAGGIDWQLIRIGRFGRIGRRDDGIVITTMAS